MKALTIYGPGQIGYADVEKPVPGPLEAVAKVSYCGICGTDAEIYSGHSTLYDDGLIHYPVRIGHEWSGVVESVGSEVKNLKPGDRVISDTGSTCGECEACLSGNYKKCRKSVPLGTLDDCHDGAFAEYECMWHWHFHKVEDGTDLMEAALVEPATISWNALIEANVKKDEVLVITGTGAIGLSAVTLAKKIGAKVYLAGRKKMKLEAGRKMGADEIIDLSETTLTDYFVAHDLSVDVLYETTGHLPFIYETIDRLSYGGRVALLSFYDQKLNNVDLSKMVRLHQSILGIEGSGWRAPEVLSMLGKGEISLAPMITQVVPFSKAAEAVASSQTNTAEKIKVMVDVSRWE